MGNETGSERLLDIQNLSVEFQMPNRVVRAVDDVSIHVDAGETVALVGESGSGKSVTALSVMQLLPYPKARHPTGSILFRGEQIMGASRQKIAQVRGNQIGMIFQEPLSALNPLHRIKKQAFATPHNASTAGRINYQVDSDRE